MTRRQFLARASAVLTIVLAALLTLAVPAFAAPAAAADTACSITGVERIVAVGDVHGAADRLAAILRAAGLIDERQRWSGGRTHLVQLGDVVDRGPESREAIDLLRRLQQEARRAGGRVHVLLGNHEVMRMLGDLRFAVPGEFAAFVTRDSETLKQRYIERLAPDEREDRSDIPLGFIDLILAFGSNGEYGSWLRGLDAVVKINGVLFVHGGISPAVANVPCTEINATVRRELTTDFKQTLSAPLSSLAAREDGPLWYRGLAESPGPTAVEVDSILASQQARAIVAGHSVTPSGRITQRFDGKVLLVDTGMQPAYVKNGRASALEIRGDAVTAIYEDGRQTLTPAPTQPPLPELQPR